MKEVEHAFATDLVILNVTGYLTREKLLEVSVTLFSGETFGTFLMLGTLLLGSCEQNRLHIVELQSTFSPSS